MNTSRANFDGPVFMDSGLAASRRPGTTPEMFARISYQLLIADSAHMAVA